MHKVKRIKWGQSQRPFKQKSRTGFKRRIWTEQIRNEGRTYVSSPRSIKGEGGGEGQSKRRMYEMGKGFNESRETQGNLGSKMDNAGQKYYGGDKGTGGARLKLRTWCMGGSKQEKKRRNLNNCGTVRKQRLLLSTGNCSLS